LLSDVSESHIRQDELRKFIDQMEPLYTTVHNVLALVTRLGYTNRTVFADTFVKIRKLNNDLQDFLETFRLSLNDSLSSEIAPGVEECRRGETVSLSLSLDSLLRK
jgi:hypothetical protein